MKYILYETETDWNVSNLSMESHFGIPNSQGTERYAELKNVSNSENADYGKYIFPVCEVGSYICTDQFSADDQVDFDPTWNIGTF